MPNTTETLYEVNEAACPQAWREIQHMPNRPLTRTRRFVAYVVIVRENGREVSRREIARGQA